MVFFHPYAPVSGIFSWLGGVSGGEMAFNVREGADILFE